MCAGMMGGMWWICPLLMLAGLSVCALIFWFFARSNSFCRPFWRAEDKPSATETPLDILKRRYARGELNKEQFEQMKKDVLA